jgi:flagellar hook-basal body complex protein FliE
MRIEGVATAYPARVREGAEVIAPGHIGSVEGLGPVSGEAQQDGARGSFGEALASALGPVNGLQADADTQAQLVATGEARDLHTAAIAMERAELALQAAVQITQKAIDAYREVSRMQV